MNRHAVEQNAVSAIGFMMGAVFLLSTMDVVLKQLVEHYSSLQVATMRCLASVPLLAAWMLVQDKTLFRTSYMKAHAIRAILGLGTLWAIGEAFRELQLADAYAIFFAAPLLLTILSGPVMKEPAGPVRMIACGIGFVGVLVVLKPGTDSLISYGSIMALVAVACYAVVALMVRALGRHEHSLTIAFWYTIIAALVGSLLLTGGWEPVAREHWLQVAIMGVTGTVGQVMIIGAFRRASAAIIAPFDYTHMIWALFYGWLFWQELPDVRTWIGAGIIISSGLFVIYREQRVAKRQKKALEAARSEPEEAPLPPH